MTQSDSIIEQTEVIDEARAQCFISLLPVDLGGDPNRYRPGRDWVRNPYRIHQRILMAFADAMPNHAEEKSGKERDCHQSILYRMDAEAGLQRVFVLSTAEPDWGKAFHNASVLLDARRPCVTREVSIMVRRGQTWRFRLRANATRRAPSSPIDKENKKRPRFAVKEAGQIPWLQRQGDMHGFSVTPEWVRVMSSGMQVSWRKKLEESSEVEAAQCDPKDAKGMFKNKLMKHWRVDYEGILQVTCPTKYVDALISGIGPGKAFGFGLLSIAPAG